MLNNILEAKTIRAAQHAAGKIYKEHKGEKGKKWGQQQVQEAVVIAKEKIKGERPTRRARSEKNGGEMSTW